MPDLDVIETLRTVRVARHGRTSACAGFAGPALDDSTWKQQTTIMPGLVLGYGDDDVGRRPGA